MSETVPDSAGVIEPLPKQTKLDPELSENEKLVTESRAESVYSISIKFQDVSLKSSYKSSFLEFLGSFSEFQVQDNALSIDIYVDPNEGSPSLGKKHKRYSKVKKELFVVDTSPTSNSAQAEPRYTTKFIISEDCKPVKEGDKNSRGCFNCGELHSLKDCPYPRDHVKINRERQKLRKSRYHLESQKFVNLQPGQLSSELRKALRLHYDETPHYVYSMRKFGYPPGWLEEAKFVHSNLDMFDIDGKNVRNPTSKKIGLDESKIIEYPGFNVPLEQGARDDFRHHGVPPYSDNFCKSKMISFFTHQFKLEQDNVESCDMEIDCDAPVESQENKIEERKSPTLVDLEQQKRELLEELNDEPKCVLNGYDSEKGFLAVKTSCIGTPLLQSSSPYSKLPDPDNFSKDVSPIINFENLPNSTGKYEQLSDVLQKVRSALKKGV